jgi:hypothetical protein
MLPTLLETLMPVFDVAARRSICIDAPAERVCQAARALPLMKTGLARRLLALRALPAHLDPSSSPEDDSVFICLAEKPGQEVVFGFAGRFWHPSRNITRLGDAESWRGYAERGSARAAVNVLVESITAERSRLATETRVLCFGAGARRIFKLYWLVTGPFSGWIREDWLRSVARAAGSAPIQPGADD